MFCTLDEITKNLSKKFTLSIFLVGSTVDEITKTGLEFEVAVRVTVFYFFCVFLLPTKCKHCTSLTLLLDPGVVLWAF